MVEGGSGGERPEKWAGGRGEDVSDFGGQGRVWIGEEGKVGGHWVGRENGLVEGGIESRSTATCFDALD